MHIPNRCLVPRRAEHLLVAGRCFSSDLILNDVLSLVQFCIAMGQAAGSAAALAIKDGVSPREVDYKVLQDRVIDQGVPLPGVKKTRTKTRNFVIKENERRKNGFPRLC